ncbi:MAG: SMC-Scp complex subunit ScpB [Elusimicrobiota bacterium]
MEKEDIKKVIETLLFISSNPISSTRFAEVLKAKEEDVKAALDELVRDYEPRALQVQEIANGYVISTRKEFSQWIREFFKEKTALRLSNSALETLSIIAYKQPVTRAEIEQIRGVDIGGVIDKLLERKLIKMVGRKETIGKPMLYGTTEQFLKYFGLKTIADLPPMEEFSKDNAAAAVNVEDENIIEERTDDNENV